MDELTLFADMRPDDTVIDADLSAIRSELFDDRRATEAILDLSQKPAGSPTAVDHTLETDPAPRRQRSLLTAAAAIVAIGVAGIWVAAERNSGPQPSAPASQSTIPSVTTATTGLNDGRLRDPAATVFGGLIEPLLPEGYDLVFASDGPEPLIVALNAAGDRFEAVIYSSAQRLAETDRIADELQLQTTEGVLAVGPDGQPDERGAYLVTEDAIITTTYTRVADPSTIPAGSAVDIARSIARDLPPVLVTGNGPRVGTQTLNEVVAAVEQLADRVDESGGNVLDTHAPTAEATGQFAALGDSETATVRVELFDGFRAPPSVAEMASTDAAQVQVTRIGTWLAVVTLDRTTPQSAELLVATTRAVTDVLETVPAADPEPFIAEDDEIAWTTPVELGSVARSQVAGIVSGPGGFVATGMGFDDSRNQGRVWFTTDGENWVEPAFELFDTKTVGLPAATSTAFYVMAATNTDRTSANEGEDQPYVENAQLYRSTDGLDWEPWGEPMGDFVDLAATGDTLLRSSGAGLEWSVDGLDWSAAAIESDNELEAMQLGGAPLVAGTPSFLHGFDGGVFTIWTSSDGRSWTKLPTPPAWGFVVSQPQGTLLFSNTTSDECQDDVVTGDPGEDMVDQQWSCSSRLEMYLLENGAPTWTQIDEPGPGPTPSYVPIYSLGNTLVAAVTAPDKALTVWTSPIAGYDWVALPATTLAYGQNVGSPGSAAAASSDNHVIVVSEDRAVDGQTGVIVGTLSD